MTLMSVLLAPTTARRSHHGVSTQLVRSVARACLDSNRAPNRFARISTNAFEAAMIVIAMHSVPTPSVLFSAAV